MIVVAWKWVAADGDDRAAGTSLADEAALEVALRLGEATADHVTVVSVGPASSERGLRGALAAGATHAVRVEAPAGVASATVAAALSSVAAAAAWVVCGDYSPDRGSGSVPAFLAAELGVAQALGLVSVRLGSTVDAVRRLDGGRREVLTIEGPAVLSVEGGVARLRRASLPAELAARSAVIETLPGPSASTVDVPLSVAPYRPRPRVLTGPAGTVHDRVRDLIGAMTPGPSSSELVALSPADAATRILALLATRR